MLNIIGPQTVGKHSIVPAIYEGDEDGGSVDLGADLSNTEFVAIAAAVVTVSDQPILLVWEESNNQSDWVAIPSARRTFLQGQDVMTFDSYPRTRRYVRARFSAGASLSASLCVLAFVPNVIKNTRACVSNKQFNCLGDN
jgi:hypothetical protein